MARFLRSMAIWSLIVFVFTELGLAQAQQDASAAGSGQASVVPAGTTLNTELSRSVDSKRAQAGDPVIAQVTEPVKIDGKVVVPKGTKVEGHVTRVTAKGKGDKDSTLAIQFDRAVLKDGRSLPLQAKIQAIAAEPRVAPVGGDVLQPAESVEGGGAATGTARNRGAMNGAAGPVGGASSGAASTVPRTVQDQSGESSSTVNGNVTRPSPGLSSTGELVSTSRGVFNLNGLALDSNDGNATEGSVIVSSGNNVHLDGGTRILLAVQTTVSVSAQR